MEKLKNKNDRLHPSIIIELNIDFSVFTSKHYLRLCCFHLRMFISDFDMMMAKKKEEMQRQRRKRKDVDLINDNDDLIADLIVKMKEAANVSYRLN